MEKVVIFGSTGMTGLCALEAAVRKGLQVRAFVRDESKVPVSLREKVEIVQGDVLNYGDVLKAVTGVKGVVVVLGTRNSLAPTTVLSDGMKNIINAMKEANVEVVSVCLSAFLFYEPEKVPPRFLELNADHKRQYDLVKNSKLKYIAVLPPHIADQPGSEYEIKHDASPGRAVSKHDLGRFLVDCLAEPDHYYKAYGISTKH